MKKITILATICGILMCTLLHAQEKNTFESLMNEKVNSIDKAKSKELLSLAADFERIAQNTQSDWTADYYAAYCRIIFALNNTDRADALCEEAEQMLISAERKGGDASEIACLRNMAATARMLVDSQTRWQQWGTEAERQLTMAIKYNDKNPRCYLLRGQSLLYTPAQFGGGADKAKPVIMRSIELYEQENVTPSYAPHWGFKMARSLASGL